MVDDPGAEASRASEADEQGSRRGSDWGKRSARHEDERRFLEGPRGRFEELRRATRIFREYVRGFRALHFVGPCVTVFGSARFEEDHPYYVLARETGRRLAMHGWTVMTGGGPGIMEAANRGAKDVHGRSVGCNIELPHEQEPNPYLDRWVDFRYFFVRKVMLVKYSYAFIAMPGGFGTMDEIFELATLIQTGKVNNFPVVLMGCDFWRPLVDYIEEKMLGGGTISAADLKIARLTDDPEKAVAMITAAAQSRFGVELPVHRRRTTMVLGEKALE